MDVEALVTIRTPDGDFPPGSVVTLDDAEADVMVARRFARRLKDGVAAVAIAPSGDQDAPASVATGALTGASTDAGNPATDAPTGAPVAVAAPVQDSATPPAGDAPADRDAAITDAFELLEQGNADHWTADGRPDVRALSAIAGFTVKAAERDRLWNARNAD